MYVHLFFANFFPSFSFSSSFLLLECSVGFLEMSPWERLQTFCHRWGEGMASPVKYMFSYRNCKTGNS